MILEQLWEISKCISHKYCGSWPSPCSNNLSKQKNLFSAIFSSFQIEFPGPNPEQRQLVWPSRFFFSLMFTFKTIFSFTKDRVFCDVYKPCPKDSPWQSVKSQPYYSTLFFWKKHLKLLISSWMINIVFLPLVPSLLE